ncbi:transcriptional regulator [Enterococcus faecalis]|uniref:hypothetical protein n=1 Tax=Enterococcus TaxID=1350 RepID=UPI0003538AB9|nr:hypothetical protein [Enterococcus faecalis]EGO6639884.1 transcriptional regulator [Enterococcus faecalis]EGO8005237.1 transcriptional regulator [Enterococcus faecalis]EGO8300628.1 transcriptional regulator [Enterococcus faecalis]EGO8756702.1 transcriptional regulator [Enterococcus faecalis]EGO8832900.1 transcriptional regulator [Enterococcus faecalis]
MKDNNSNLSTYAERLLKQVMDNSEATDWDNAVLEWDITAWDEDDELKTSCLCGKENLRYLFTITNRENGNELEPIGSQCIKKFEREDLNEETAIFEKLFKLQAALSSNKYIGLSSDFFSRKLLDYFYEQNVFNYNDLVFLKKMFNKRDKSKITSNQQKKINFHIIGQIIPYLRTILS